ncbi:Copper transporter 3 [Morella rubra]|uniref:Copper transport protein n=1 Tax=Morella rubra TaxID=262757 RepID=A0A6A1UJ46_9ROSI|nr:Copper transporter 3 [Morella rubra]
MYVLALFCVFVLALSIEVLSSLSTVKPGTNPIQGGLTQASLYALRMGFAYLVMLAVMSFNLGIFIAAVAGHAVGFFLIKTRALALTKSTDQTTSSTGVARKV